MSTARGIVGAGRPLHDAFDLPELPPNLDHNLLRCLAYRLNGERAKEEGQEPANEESGDDVGIAQVEGQAVTPLPEGGL